MKFHQSVLVLVVLSSSLIMTGCTDAEVGASIGAVIGAVIGSDIADDSQHVHNPPRYHHHHQCDRGGCWSETRSLDLGVEMGESSAVLAVAEKYEISTEASSVLVNSLLEAQAGDLSSVEKMGMDKADLVAIFNNQNPSASALVKMSEALGMDVGATHNLIQKIKIDITASRALL